MHCKRGDFGQTLEKVLNPNNKNYAIILLSPFSFLVELNLYAEMERFDRQILTHQTWKFTSQSQTIGINMKNFCIGVWGNSFR